jgi:hypothetical protein
VHEGIHQGLAQNLERDLVNILTIDTPDFTADVQVFFEEGNTLIELGEQIVPHIAAVVDVEPVRSLERQERHLRLMQVVIDVLGEEENARVFDPGPTSNLEAAQEVGQGSRADVDARFLGERAYLNLGDIVKGESLDRFLLKRQGLVLREHDAQLVVAHLLSVAVEPPVVAGAAGVRLCRAFLNLDGHDFADLGQAYGDTRLAVPRQAVDPALEVIRKALTYYGAVIPDSQEQRPNFAIGEGYDVFVNTGRVFLLKFISEAFTLTDEEFYFITIYSCKPHALCFHLTTGTLEFQYLASAFFTIGQGHVREMLTFALHYECKSKACIKKSLFHVPISPYPDILRSLTAVQLTRKHDPKE